MRKGISTVCVLVLCSFLVAAPPTVDIPSEVKPTGDYATIIPKTDAKAISYIGMSGVDPFPSEFLKDAKSFVLPVRGLAPGKYMFRGVASLNDEHRIFEFAVIVGNNPNPPPTPGPIPDPTPLPPVPVGFRVIFVYESSDLLTLDMQKVMFGESVVKYLDTKTVSKGWRRYDKDVDATNEKDIEIRDLWATAKSQITQVPRIIIAVNEKVEIVPFPKSEAETLTLLKKYGGE